MKASAEKVECTCKSITNRPLRTAATCTGQTTLAAARPAAGRHAQVKAGTDPQKMAHKLGDGNNAHELVHSMVQNNIRRRDEVYDFLVHTMRGLLGMPNA